LRKIGIAAVLLGSLCVVAVAQGKVVQQFNFTLKDIRSDGRYTVVFESRSFDDQGAIPAPLNENTIRIPKGATIRKEFLNKRYYCPLKKLVDQIRVEKPRAVRFVDFLNKKLKGKKTPPKNSKNIVSVCRFARIGSGEVLVDARPFADPLIPANLAMFLGKPTAPGAVASFVVVGIPDERAAIVRDNPTIRETYPVVNVNFFNQPSADGKYGYKVVLPTGPINGINISVERLKVTMPAFTLTKKKVTCAKRSGGKCKKRKVKKSRTFMWTKPDCPPSGKISFEAFYGYATEADETKTIEIPCPKFE
jgi:hypothetical protein